MKKIINILHEKLEQAFTSRGYDGKFALVNVSDRPDLCDYQSNGAMSAAKTYRKPPMSIAEEVVSELSGDAIFTSVQALHPGFINITLSQSYLAGYIHEMLSSENSGVEKTGNPKKIIIDYGGANVAKPLHVGHLRPAIIGESLKRMGWYVGHEVIGDVHLGDWGLPIGLVITEIKRRNPELAYFDEDHTGEYPVEPPFTISDLEEIYPLASVVSKEDPDYRDEAMQVTYKLQNGHPGYTALWTHILNVSIADLKKNYDKLQVSFELWKKESDAQEYIPDMVQYLKDNDYAHLSDGALVVDVKQETDAKEMPPCMILKSNGAALYNTTDLATIVERMRLFKPDEVIYVTDKRQELYFEQIFRCAKKTRLVEEKTRLAFVGNGTMNNKDGKPFRTRDGGTMRLEHLIEEINSQALQKMHSGETGDVAEAEEIAVKVGLAALKYGDLSNLSHKDYIFDIERFSSFEGNTGPYILYTAVRIKSILRKYWDKYGDDGDYIIIDTSDETEKNLMLQIVRFNGIIQNAFEGLAPHKVCTYVYTLANAFNRLYHNVQIISEADENRRKSLIGMLIISERIMRACVDVLGFEIPERM